LTAVVDERLDSDAFIVPDRRWGQQFAGGVRVSRRSGRSSSAIKVIWYSAAARASRYVKGTAAAGSDDLDVA